MRAIFFDEDDAATAVARLTSSGYAARLVRERLAGEDDDEDHPWAVLSDAPEVLLELLVDELDGWLDTDDHDPTAEPPGAPGPALELPSEPKRVKRPGPDSLG